MTLETLVSAVKENTTTLASKMKLESDAIVINQCNVNVSELYEYQGHRILCLSFNEKGVGLSRNSALMRATADIILFSDEDIVYAEGYAKKVLQAFSERPYADMLLFNMDVTQERATYHTDHEFRVHRYNCGRYPTYSFAIRREILHQKNITFSLLFGGGAKYSNGEDSIFIRDCIKSGMRVYALPITIGKEVARPSTWFHGYTEKFFFDRGVLYQYLYGPLKKPLALRFLLKNRTVFFDQAEESKLSAESENSQNLEEHQVTDFKEAYQLMKQGMREMRK